MARSGVLALGWFVIAVGAWVLVLPDGLVRLADIFLTSVGLWVAVVLRLAFGALLWVAAPDSRTPRIFRILGVLVFVSGLALPLIGLARMRALADWGAGLDPLNLRLVALATAGLGAFVVWSAWPRRSDR